MRLAEIARQEWYDDEWRITICPHDTFLANDGENNFLRNAEAYLSKTAPLPPTLRFMYQDD